MAVLLLRHFNKSLYEECEEFDIYQSSSHVLLEGTKSSHVVSDNYAQAKLLLNTFIVWERNRRFTWQVMSRPTPTANARQDLLKFSEDLTGKQTRVGRADYDYLDSLDTIRALFSEPFYPQAISVRQIT